MSKHRRHVALTAAEVQELVRQQCVPTPADPDDLPALARYLGRQGMSPYFAGRRTDGGGRGRRLRAERHGADDHRRHHRRVQFRHQVLQHPPNVRVTGVTATGNPLGIGVASTTGALLAGNKATNNTGSGIRLSFGSDSNRVVGNAATGNRNFDLADFNLPACVNTWQGNTFVTDNEGNGPGAGCIQ